MSEFRPVIDGGMLAGAIFYAGIIWWQVQANAEDLAKVSEARVVAIEKDVESTKQAAERIEKQQEKQQDTLDKIYDELRKQ